MSANPRRSSILDRIESPEAAADRIRSMIARTRLIHAAELAALSAAPVALKLEQDQVTGSFKVRGAANRLLTLSSAERRLGVVACSSGNHGRAVAHVAQSLGIPATVVVPDWVDTHKLEAIRASGAETVLGGASYDTAEEHARGIVRATGRVWIDPFDDPAVIAGQSTVGQEILNDVPEVDTVVVPLSGGGLVAGIASAIRQSGRAVRLIAVSAKNADVMLRSLAAGRPVSAPEEETIAGALSGGIGQNNRFTFEAVRDHVDEHFSVDEPSIRRAMVFAYWTWGFVLEGGGAVALAAALDGALVGEGRPNGRTVLVLSGGNIDSTVFSTVLSSADDSRPGY